MLTTSHLNSTFEENDLSTYLIIPFDSLKNPDDFTQLRVLPDGTLYIVNGEDQQLQDKPLLPALTNEIIDVITEQASTLPPETSSSLVQVPVKPISEPNIVKKDSFIGNILPSPSEVKYNCIKCPNSFTTDKEYKNHLKWHKSQKNFKCTKCSAGYNIENNLKIHTTLIHPEGTINSCPICGVSLTFQRAASLKSHLMVHLVEELQTCDECDAEIEKVDEYAQHMLGHASKTKSNPESLTCLHCDVEFKTKQQLKLHISDHTKAWKYFKKKKVKRIPSQEKRYNCGICNKNFLKQSLLERHERIHSGEKPFKCNICDQCFTQKGTLRIHLLRHTGNKPFACTLCSAKFSQKGNLRVHINKTHTAPNEGQKMFKCPHCSCIFKRIASLNGHVTKAHLKYRFTEEDLIGHVMKNLKDLEENTFDSYVTLTESTLEGVEKKFVVQMKRIGEVRWYKCSYCSKMCKKPSDLIRHIRVHTRERPFTCKICRKSFSLKSTLISHMNTHSKNIKCKLCDSVFGSKKILNLHIRKHEKEKLSKWQCTTCGVVFDKYTDALRHKMSQEQPHPFQSMANKAMKQPLYQTLYGNLTFKPPRLKVPNSGNENSLLRPFHCLICDARFTRKINLKRHTKYHENDRRFKCHLCSKAFITSYRLKEHINLHNNIKNYACKVCNKRFGTSTNLRRHMITHNTKKPYLCPYCLKYFQTLDLSRRHIKSVHKKDIIKTIDSEIDARKQSIENGICSEGTSIIMSSESPKTDTVLDLNTESKPVEDILLDENTQPSQILLQDPSTGLQTFYVNLENIQLIGNSGVNLSSFVENTANEEPFSLPTPTTDLPEKNQNQQNQVLMYSPTQPTSTLNLATSEAIFDGNTIVQPSVGLNESRNIFDDASIICINCNKMFSNFVRFQKHVCINKEQIAEKEEEINSENKNVEKEIVLMKNLKKFQCPICHKSYRKKISYKNHMKTHPNMQCLICNQMFSDKDDYLEHMATHNTSTATNENICVFCMKKFKKPSDLTRHIRTHTGEKPFNCEICDKRFSLKSTLKSHFKTHNPNHKHFGCAICNTFFSSKSSLKVHMTIHTGQLPYSCSICKSKFRTISAKKCHEKKGHRQVLKKNSVKQAKSSISNILNTLSTDIKIQKNNQEEIQVESEYVPLENLGMIMTENSDQTLELPSQIVNLDIPPETILPEDPSNLLHQLQMTDMVLTTNETEAVPSLILDDVSFLDLNVVANNLQIISLPEADGRVTISIKENEKNEQNKVQIKPEKEKPKPVECDICHKTYASKDGLRKHKKNVHGNKKKFGCDKCDEKFESKEKLQNHEKEHCLCMLCALKFNEDKSLVEHMDDCHQEDSSKDDTSALLSLKFDLPSATIDEPLFNSLFMLKK